MSDAKIRLQRVKFNKTKISHKHELRLCFEFVRYTKKVQVVVDKQAAVWNVEGSVACVAVALTKFVYQVSLDCTIC